jgi:predicted PhzF superfamily epimerase YddE/YHI9
MRAFTMFQADAFTSEIFKGNPAAVLVLDHPLGDDDMQSIAAENNLAETAFVERQGSGWTIRWFTPAHEAAFCGHATLASAHVLATAYGVSGPISFSTRSVGQLTVSPSGDGGYDLDLPAVAAHDLAPSPVLADLFPDGWSDSFRSFENIFIVLPSPEEVQSFQPDMSRIATLRPSVSASPPQVAERTTRPAAGISASRTGTSRLPAGLGRLAVFLPFDKARRGCRGSGSQRLSDHAAVAGQEASAAHRGPVRKVAALSRCRA